MKCIFLLFFTLTCPLIFASEQKLYNSLHHATNLLIQITEGSCPPDIPILQKVLEKADANLAEHMMTQNNNAKKAEFEFDLHKTWSFFKTRKNNNTLLLFAFQDKLHLKAKKLKLEHGAHWRKEISNCGKGLLSKKQLQLNTDSL
ncbi:MAG: hypothetical protein HOO06_01545 [Bdellovibrionaceae bacterium]|jgi:hypothetical protein|nr:hypothetical protein [Pseudobdellovibrionaceae bacterium]